MRQKDDAKPRDGFGGGRSTDDGYGNRGPRRSDTGGNDNCDSKGHDSGATGWGNDGENKQGSSTGWDNVGDGGYGGYGAGGGGDDGCRICRETGHMVS